MVTEVAVIHLDDQGSLRHAGADALNQVRIDAYVERKSVRSAQLHVERAPRGDAVEARHGACLFGGNAVAVEGLGTAAGHEPKQYQSPAHVSPLRGSAAASGARRRLSPAGRRS